jgi:hypothetical protein
MPQPTPQYGQVVFIIALSVIKKSLLSYKAKIKPK